MKVLLIRPRPDPDSIGLQSFMMCEPLELEYAAAYLERFGHQVTILDMILERAPLEGLLRDHAPDVVGVTGYLNHVGVMKDYARRIKRHDSRCWVVVGGVHAEVEPEVFEDPDIDFVLHVGRARVDACPARRGRPEQGPRAPRRARRLGRPGQVLPGPQVVRLPLSRTAQRRCATATATTTSSMRGAPR